jgi:hypothetical protein
MTEFTVHDISAGPKRWSRVHNGECLEFTVSWFFDMTTEPIWNLIDVEAEEVAEKLVPILKEYLNRAKYYPNTARNCWFCDTKACCGNSLCKEHESIGKWLFPLIEPVKDIEIEERLENLEYPVLESNEETPPPVIRQQGFSTFGFSNITGCYRSQCEFRCTCSNRQVPMYERWLAE